MIEMTNLTPLHDPRIGQMRVVGLMSGSGSSLRKILEYESGLRRKMGKSPYQVVAIFSDSADSKAPDIGRDYNLPVIIRDINAYHAEKGRPLKDMDVREQFDMDMLSALAPYRATAAAYAGYMSIASIMLVNGLLGINVHPADLSILNADSTRKYTGSNAVRDAIAAGEKQLRSTTHLIEPAVDQGRILMISEPLEVRLDGVDLKYPEVLKSVAAQHQNLLKQVGDWTIFPKTLRYIAEGRFARDGQGNIYFDGSPMPNGLKLN